MDRLLTTLRRTQTSKVVAVVRAAGRGGGGPAVARRSVRAPGGIGRHGKVDRGGGSWSLDLRRRER